ncbi:MAG TPA: xanthine dehydrogenase family protein molybdopterin-binding subunit [Stellaceae bacterium]|nr:xanthine dehydrogenase family protein molybdopterin-binding subunit [Stellaceae bacterium]
MTGNSTNGAWGGRVEDEALLRGRGRFAADAWDPGQTYACFVRSPHAFARIRAVDAGEARRAPGVLAVLTAADTASVGSISCPQPQKGRDGAALRVPHRPALAGERVLHAGEPVALVVAETAAAAQDAAELVDVAYDELSPAIDLRAAAADGAPQIHPEAPGNVAIDFALGGEPETLRAIDEAFRGARHVARVSLVNQRIVVASMEPRGATAAYDAASDGYVLRCGSQGVTMLRDQLVGILGFERERLRVVTDDVGGAFGMKAPAYPEYAALLVAAKQVGRPVHWMSTRSEAFVTDQQARDTVTDMALALDAEGRFVALKASVLAAMGAYITSHGAFIATSNFARCLSSVYRIPRITTDIRCIFTNTVPTGPYRGAGRPEANYAIERLVDEAARVSGIDRIALRRRNFITAAEMPYATPIGVTYDSGDFPAIFEEALQRADVAGFAQRRARSAAAGKRRGLGISCFLEHAGGAPTEGAAVVFPGGGMVAVDLAVGPSGQGHATVFRRLVAERLGLPEAQVVMRTGDTRLGVDGVGTVASRNTMTSGSASLRAVELVIEKGRRIASRLLEAAEADIEYAEGVFRIAGTDRYLSLLDLAEKAAARGEPLDSKTKTDTPQSFPNGCHICEVEIDPEDGSIAIAAYTAVDDCGKALDPVLVEGQIQGGVAQGIGQALCEEAVYDPDSGQLLAGSFMDYAMPRADNVPDVAGTLHPVPCRTNPLGVKGTGEAGTTAALAAVMNAISDAIPGSMLDMPATPEKLWRACQDASRRS